MKNKGNGARRSLVAFVEPGPGHKGWHSRGYLPHFDSPELIQTVTFRLADSLPHSKQYLFDLEDEVEKRTEFETCLNRGYGECWLGREDIAGLVEDALLHFDGERYRMLAWVVMPNHVHAVFEPITGFSLGGIVDSWKGHTASEGNKALRRKGAFWAKDYFDRYVRDVSHFERAVDYVHANPVKAGLSVSAEDFRWSSAYSGRTRAPVREPDYRGNFA